MNTSAAQMAVPIELSDRAASKIQQMMADQSGEALMLRVFIQGGGCSGFEYGFDFEHAAHEDDQVIEQGSVTLLIDPMSFPYLMGASIDYLEDLQGARFVVNNPNAQTTCGCGTSFSM